MTIPNQHISRGEIWLVDFDPTQGQEIQKRRPAVVMSIGAVWRLRLHIVVPITSWQARFENEFWMIKIPALPSNGLRNDSGADAFQIKSVAESRFIHKIGNLTADQMEEIAAAIVICIGFTP